MQKYFIGKNLKSLREKGNIAQGDMAKHFKIANSTLSQYESGKRMPSYDMISDIADYFSVSVDYLMGRDDEMHLSDKPKDESMLEIMNMIKGEDTTLKDILLRLSSMAESERKSLLFVIQNMITAFENKH